MKVGFTASAFDLLHAGHVQMLREAKEQCDYLLCGLQIDPSLDRNTKNAPLQTTVETNKKKPPSVHDRGLFIYVMTEINYVSAYHLG